MSRAVFPLLVLAVLSLPACSGGPFGGSSGGSAVGPSGAAAGPAAFPAPSGPADLDTQQACRRRVNEMYETRERTNIYAANPSSNSPFSGNSEVGVPSRGLSGQFAFERSLADCESNSRSGKPAGY